MRIEDIRKKLINWANADDKKRSQINDRVVMLYEKYCKKTQTNLPYTRALVVELLKSTWKDPFKLKVSESTRWSFIKAHQKEILNDTGDWPNALYAASTIIQHLDTMPIQQLQFYKIWASHAKARKENPIRLKYLRDRAWVNNNYWNNPSAGDPKTIPHGPGRTQGNRFDPHDPYHAKPDNRP